MAHCLRAKNYVNLMVGSKQPTPVWLSPEEADKVRAPSRSSRARAHAVGPVTALHRRRRRLEVREHGRRR
jgi:hypothetical protein